MNLVNKYRPVYTALDADHIIVKIKRAASDRAWCRNYIGEYFIVERDAHRAGTAEHHYMPDDKLRADRNMPGRPILKSEEIEIIKSNDIVIKPWNWDDYINKITRR